MLATLSMAARQARLSALLALMEAGARLDFYAGTAPAKCEQPTSHALLASIPLPQPAGLVAVLDGIATLTLTTPLSVHCIKTGIIGWARFLDGETGGIMDLSVGMMDSNAPVWVSDTKIYSGGELQLLSCIITEQ